MPDFNVVSLSALINSVVNDIDDEIQMPDVGARDVANLIVNVFIYRLTYPLASVDDCIEACYDEDPETVKGWCES